MINSKRDDALYDQFAATFWRHQLARIAQTPWLASLWLKRARQCMQNFAAYLQRLRLRFAALGAKFFMRKVAPIVAGAGLILALSSGIVQGNSINRGSERLAPYALAQVESTGPRDDDKR